MHNVLSASSHHLIVYKDDMDTTEQLDADRRASRSPARSTRRGMVAPLVITQKEDDEITLPDGVAYTFAPHQMIKLEMHYLNAIGRDADGAGDRRLLRRRSGRRSTTRRPSCSPARPTSTSRRPDATLAPVLHGAERTSTSAQSKFFAITGHSTSSAPTCRLERRAERRPAR